MHRRGAALLLAALLLGGCSATGEPRQLGVGTRIPIGEGVTQTFVPGADDLSAVTLWTAYDGGPPAGLLEVDLTVGGVERSTVVDGSAFQVDQPVRVAFEPVPDSAGERARMTVRWSGEPALSLLGTRADAYDGGELTPGPGDLRFVVGHADRIGGTLQAAGELAGQARDRAADDPVFTVLWVATLLALAVAAVRSGRSRATSRPAARD